MFKFQILWMYKAVIKKHSSTINMIPDLEYLPDNKLEYRSH